MNASFMILGQSFSLLELLGAATGILAVWLTTVRSILCFPIGILNVSIYAFIFFSPDVRLYADGLLQIAFGLLLAYGWKNWASLTRSNTEAVSKLERKTIFNLLLISIPSSIFLGEVLIRFTDAALPRLDATLTICSLVGQWLIAKRKVENWFLWIIVNIVYIPIYWYRSLPVTAALYLIYLLLAVKGLNEWKTSSKKQTAP